jgi:hypothetical protein
MWINNFIEADILTVPFIGPDDADKLADDDGYGVVTNSYDLLAKWLSFHKADKDGPAAPNKTNKKFLTFLEAKGVGADDNHRRSIVDIAYQKLQSKILPPLPPPPPAGY